MYTKTSHVYGNRTDSTDTFELIFLDTFGRGTDSTDSIPPVAKAIISFLVAGRKLRSCSKIKYAF